MDFKNLPGIGRGGRGAIIEQLLKAKENGETLLPKIKPGIIASQSEGRRKSFGTCLTPGASGSAVMKHDAGRGKMTLQLLQGANYDLKQSHGRGQGLFDIGGCKTVQESVLAEKDITKPPDESRNPSLNSATLLCKSNEKLHILKEDKIIQYHGSSGKPVPVAVNCVRINYQNKVIYQYHVAFNPSVDSKNMRYTLLNQHRTVIGNTKAFDGSVLYLPKKLPSDEMKLQSVRFTDQSQIEICIHLTQAIDPASPRLIPFYNTILRRCLHSMEMCPVGRNYYDPNDPKKIERLRLSLWPGYVTTIKAFEGGVFLNIDVSHKVLRSDTAHHVMKNIYQRRPNVFKELCVKELVGAVVLTRYNNKNYRVDDISWDLSPTSSFTNSNGKSVTFQEYYRVQYKIEIQDLLQPMLVHRPKWSTQRAHREKEGKPVEICLVPELCFLTGLSDNLRSDFRAMKEIKEHTCLPPTDRNAVIEQFLSRIQTTPGAKEELLKWGLELDTSTVVTNARSFPPEKIMSGRQQVFSCGSNADFTKEVTRLPVIRPVHINHWLLFFTARDAKKAKLFYQKMVEVAGKLGIEIARPNLIELNDDRGTSYKNAISSSINPNVQLVVCIFPSARDDRYNAVKRLCCVDMPVPSQIILSRTLPDDPKVGKFRSVAMKIALQINCKLGGELWAVDIPLKSLMVCGIDVYHDCGRNGRSVAAFVASTNKLLTRWYSRAIIQQPHQELIDGLKHCFTESIKKFYEVNHFLPDRIIIFRDGVGDGQLNHVAEHEISQIRSCFSMFDRIQNETYSPKLSLVVVSKRINVRYFAAQQKFMENPPPGTVLDHTVTRPNWPDFFLVSQHVRQGTVSPSHYIVVSGQEHLKPDHMQRLSYKLTHMYYNWPGTVRVPAPCQYAHKLAYLVGQNIRQEPAVELCDRLFYL